MWGCLRGGQSGDPKAAAAFFRGAKGPLNPSLYSAAAMLPKAARLNAFSPRKVYEPVEADRYRRGSVKSTCVCPRGRILKVCDNTAWILGGFYCAFLAAKPQCNRLHQVLNQSHSKNIASFH